MFGLTSEGFSACFQTSWKAAESALGNGRSGAVAVSSNVTT